jgi:hypothetical protein
MKKILLLKVFNSLVFATFLVCRKRHWLWVTISTFGVLVIRTARQTVILSTLSAKLPILLVAKHSLLVLEKIITLAPFKSIKVHSKKFMRSKRTEKELSG